MNKKKVYKNPVCAIAWLDATYSFSKKYPKEFPKPQVTTGFIVQTNENYVNIATNVSYNIKSGELVPIDGFVIPNKAELDFIRLSNLNNEKKIWLKE